MTKELYELGTFPPPGEIPRLMYASVIRRERYGEPKTSFRTEIVETPRLKRNKVCVAVMASGVDFNNVWAGLGKPIDLISARLKRKESETFHIGGSEGSGIVWAVGEGVTQVKVGDPVILSGCCWDETAPDIRLGAEPIASSTQKVWGYENNYGALAQFTVVDEYQCHPKPRDLTWEEAACFLISAATTYRQLQGWPPNTVQPGDPVLIWGGAGGLGTMAIQLTKLFGGIPIAVVSNPDRAAHCIKLGARGVIDRREFGHWGVMPDTRDEDAYMSWVREVTAFRRHFWKALGERRLPKIVVEHSGMATVPTSMFMCDNAGMVVLCGATSGFMANIDLRFLWMHQKRLQGTHFASTKQCRAVIHLVSTKALDPCLAETFSLDDAGKAHQLMFDNQHPPGNMALLVNAPHAGMKSIDD